MTQTGLVELIVEDHQHIKAEFDEMLQALETQSVTEEDLRHLIRDLVTHEVAEEEIVWPTVRIVLEDGNRLAQARINEESEAEELLKDLEMGGVESEQFESLFSKVRDSVLSHAAAEEVEVFPKLQQALDADRSELLGTWWEAAKSMAPTHPHPSTPNTASARGTVGPIISLIDRTRDAIREAKPQ